MTSFERVARLLTTAAFLALTTTVANAAECKDPKQLVFSIIPTEETT